MEIDGLLSTAIKAQLETLAHVEALENVSRRWPRRHHVSPDAMAQTDSASQAVQTRIQRHPVIEAYRAQGYGFRRIAALLNLSDYKSSRGKTWHPTTVVRVRQTYTTHPVQLKLLKPPAGGNTVT